MAESTAQTRWERFWFKYRDLFTQKMSKAEFKFALSEVKAVPKNQVVFFEGMSLHPLLAANLMGVGSFKNVQLLNAYQLINIYLDKDEEWKSISDIECEILVITLGYAEFPNKQQGNIICQAIEQQLARGQQFWLFVRGNSGLSSYPEVQKCIQERGFEVRHVKFNPSQVAGEVI